MEKCKLVIDSIFLLLDLYCLIWFVTGGFKNGSKIGKKEWISLLLSNILWFGFSYADQHYLHWWNGIRMSLTGGGVIAVCYIVGEWVSKFIDE